MHTIVIKGTAFDRLFPGDKFACLGHQVALIVQGIEESVGPHIWYAQYVEAMSARPTCFVELSELRAPARVGDGPATVRELLGVSQFIWGVLGGTCDETNLRSVELHGPEEAPTSLKSPVVVEIHLFDGTSIEVYLSEARDYSAMVAWLRNLLPAARERLRRTV